MRCVVWAAGALWARRRRRIPLFYGETLAVLTRSVKQGLGAEAALKGGIMIKISKKEVARAERRRARADARDGGMGAGRRICGSAGGLRPGATASYGGGLKLRFGGAMGIMVKIIVTALCLSAIAAPAGASPGAAPGATAASQDVAAEERSSGELLLATSPVTYGEEGFMARIAQRTGGSRAPIGLVLSGGSARAFAHIGVLRRLEELGVVPDFIVANSMGSIVGLLYAAGLSPDQIYELVAGTEIAALFEPSLPLRGGILDPRRFSDLVELYVGNPRLEELPIPILVACEDLITKREIRLAAGELRAVLEASYALPVYFPPVPYEGHLLVDGGITNLVPLGTAMEYSPYVVVSSTFYDAKGLNLRNPLVILNTSIDIGKRRAGVADLQEYPDALWIRCSVESFSFMSFDRLAELEREGYRSADANAAGIAALKAAAYGAAAAGGAARRREAAATGPRRPSRGGSPRSGPGTRRRSPWAIAPGRLSAGRPRRGPPSRSGRP